MIDVRAGGQRGGGEGRHPAASSVPVPSVVAPSRKVTVPVGVPPPGVGADRRRERHRLAEDRRVGRRGQRRRRRDLRLTTWVRAVEVLVAKLPSLP